MTRAAGPVPSVGGVIRTTFGPDTWRRLGYATVTLPVALAALLLTLLGRPARAAVVQRRVADRLLFPPGPGPAGPPDRLPAVGYALLSVPFGLVGLWLAAAIGPNTVRNLLYGLVTDGSYAHSWGGPTLAGAWAVHALGALALVPVGLWLVRGLTAVQRRLAGALLGGDRLPVAVAAGAAAVLAGAGVFLAAWVSQI